MVEEDGGDRDGGDRHIRCKVIGNRERVLGSRGNEVDSISEPVISQRSMKKATHYVVDG